MGCKLTQNIKHNCEYNPGGISEVILLDIKDFNRYEFKDDGLYNSCFVEGVFAHVDDYITLDVVNESVFTEQVEGEMYKQELQTFIRSLGGDKTSQLLTASRNKYIVIYKTYDGRAFTFGQDGGAALTFSQQSGQVGEASGYPVTISKLSVYPQFEIWSGILKIPALVSEENILMITEDGFSVDI